MDILLKGIVKFGRSTRPSILKQLEEIKDDHSPSALLFTCMDSRVLPSAVTAASVGQMFVVRNAGNLVPHASSVTSTACCTTEPAALQLACLVNKVRDVIVCGHSDCKAMQLLRDLRLSDSSSCPAGTSLKVEHERAPLCSWVGRHGAVSAAHWLSQQQQRSWRQPLELTTAASTVSDKLSGRNIDVSGESRDRLSAVIDPDNKLCESDKLSQINTLQQMLNISSYEFLHHLLVSGRVRTHAIWLQLHTARLWYFSRARCQFVPVNDETLAGLLSELPPNNL